VSPEYHGWTHAPKEQGGTDPVPFPPSGGGGPIPWVVLKDHNVGQAFSAGASTTLVYPNVVNPYPAVFQTPIWGVPGPAHDYYYAVKVLEDGLYSMSGNLSLQELVVGAFSIDLINIDPASGARTERETYIGANSATGPIVSGGATWEGIWRLAANDLIYSIVYNNTGAAFHTYHDGGAFWEVRKLGDATATGRNRSSAT
jgi:hypothetical protein